MPFANVISRFRGLLANQADSSAQLAAVNETQTASTPLTTVVTTARFRTLGPIIAIVNMSTVLSDQQIAQAVSDLQVQVDRDFAPVWGLGANLMAVPRTASVPAQSWIIYIMDTSDEAGALGYHDLTPLGNPVGKTFAKDDIKYGLSWTVTLSHELLEMLADPYISYTVFDQQTDTTGTLYPVEVCDAVEADQFGYLINSTRVSDFVYPAWFESFRPARSTRFDKSGVLTQPLQLAKGGYIGVFVVGPNTAGWKQKFADTVPQRLINKGDRTRSKRRGHGFSLPAKL